VEVEEVAVQIMQILEMAILLAHLRHKEVMEVLAKLMPLLLAVAVVVEHLLLGPMVQAVQEVLAVLEQPLLCQGHPLLMLEVVEVVLLVVAPVVVVVLVVVLLVEAAQMVQVPLQI